ncbi:glucose 1-dehydrogenase [Flavobacterium zepuense]|uniref:Glucose 1-dehydrogenase n=1 Tax=Flavobacterium zepuense TaxID=2593302 RepID=A0A552V7Q5_9FLAO|nr:glucose 1-dehydrogenase [Flavobacterium zepuense]TRW26480.1 glucose 1-dehydrogenase [Flavobacterium zepuense]
MKKLEGKVAIVTGSDSGIGAAIAIEYAKEGANVVVTYHTDEEGAQKTVAAIEEAGQKAIMLKIDVTLEPQITYLFSKTIETFGTVDILVNNAGVKGAGKPVVDMTTEDFNATLQANLYGPFYTCRSFAQYRKGLGGKGKIINITSVHEEIMSKNGADYNAAKGALRNFTRTLALELAEIQINVNNIGPGMIVTPMNQDILEDEEALKEKSAKVPFKRAGYPEDIAKLALFLASADSDYVTGSTYFMDGGLMLQMGAEI